MKVSELIKELKKLPKDAEIYMVKDWNEEDEQGHWLDLYRLDMPIDQTVYTETSMDFDIEHQIIMVFEEERAKARVEHNENWL